MPLPHYKDLHSIYDLRSISNVLQGASMLAASAYSSAGSIRNSRSPTATAFTVHLTSFW
jgi:hypothetical protein